jgi:hypothetical protein
MAVLYFDQNSRFDLNIMAEFLKDCQTRESVLCVCAESSEETDAEVTSFFEGTEQAACVFRGKTDKPTPRIEFLKGGAESGSIEKDGAFGSKTGIYLDFIAGTFSSEELETKLKAADGAEMYKKIVPRMNFVLMLAKKGQVDSAIKELDKIDSSLLDDKGKLLLGQTYLRLNAPERTAAVLSSCPDRECVFYRGIAEYFSGSAEKAIFTLNSLKGLYDENKLNYYLKKIYEAQGDKKHADDIRLPENYNVNLD